MQSHAIRWAALTLFLAATAAGAQTSTQQPSQPTPGATSTQGQQPGTPAGTTTTPEATTSDAKFTIDGEMALWTVAVRPDKTADFEQVMTRLREALAKSSKPERQRQAAGWKLLKLSTPLPDKNVAYVHVLNPVVPGADYGVMQILYDEFPDERVKLYELYRGAFAGNLSLATGGLVMDMGSAAAVPPAAPSTAPTAAPPAAPAPSEPGSTLPAAPGAPPPSGSEPSPQGGAPKP